MAIGSDMAQALTALYGEDQVASNRHHAQGRHERGGSHRDRDLEVRGDSGRLPGHGRHGHHRESPLQELQRAEGLRAFKPRSDFRNQGYKDLDGRHDLQGSRTAEGTKLRTTLTTARWSDGHRG